MLWKIINHELRLLRKDKTVWIALICFALVIGYAVLNRSAEIERQKAHIKEWPAINERNIRKHQEDARAIERKIEAGEYKDELPIAYNARNARWVVTYLTATVPLPPSPLSALSVGRSDLDTLAYKVNTIAPVEPRREQTDYPLKSLMGHLDLAFVILYLYPLFILGLSFNLISSEKETGTLALLLSQPLTMRTLVLGKATARAFLIFGSTILFSAIALLFSNVNFADSTVIAGLFLWLAAVIAYGIFWFGLALIANHRMHSSAACALALMIGWFVLTILLPGTINLTATMVFPVPSRTEFIDARRAFSLEVGLEGGEAREQRIKAFLGEQPEFPADYKYEKPALDWMDFSQRHVETAKRMQPITDRFDRQLENQRRLTKYLSLISPLTIMQNLLPEIAGTGRLRYRSFLAQVDESQAAWRKLLWPKGFFQEPMSSSDYDLIPRFKFVEPVTALAKEVYQPVLLMVLHAFLAVFLGLRLFAKPNVMN